jgi:hypothetical protein
MNETMKNQLDDWLKGLGWLAIIGAIIAFCLIGFYTYFTRGTISNQQSDWASFGSFLSGVFSFLGAIGTVGVMLLGIKQFKVQQDQINAQTERQNSFEEKQGEKWAKENEMLNFQKYQMHISQFNELLGSIEKELSITFKNKSDHYSEMFPNNKFLNTDFTVNRKESTWISKLDVKLGLLQSILDKYNRSPSANHFQSAMTYISDLQDILDIECNDYLEQNNNIIFNMKITNIKKIVTTAIVVSQKLSQFSSFTLDSSHKNLTYVFSVINGDINEFLIQHRSNVKGTFLEFLFLLKAAIKSNSASNLELYQLSLNERTAPTPMDPIPLLSIDNIDNIANISDLIIQSALSLDEQQVLIEKLETYHKALLKKVIIYTSISTNAKSGAVPNTLPS